MTTVVQDGEKLDDSMIWTVCQTPTPENPKQETVFIDLEMTKSEAENVMAGLVSFREQYGHQFTYDVRMIPGKEPKSEAKKFEFDIKKYGCQCSICRNAGSGMSSYGFSIKQFEDLFKQQMSAAFSAFGGTGEGNFSSSLPPPRTEAEKLQRQLDKERGLLQAQAEELNRVSEELKYVKRNEANARKELEASRQANATLRARIKNGPETKSYDLDSVVIEVSAGDLVSVGQLVSLGEDGYAHGL